MQKYMTLSKKIFEMSDLPVRTFVNSSCNGRNAIDEFRTE